MATTKKTPEELLRDKIMEQFVNGKAGSEAKKEPEKPKPKRKLFKTVKVDNTNMVEFEEVTGEAHYSGSKLYWPASILHTKEEWPEFMQLRIPEPSTSFIPNHDYVVALLDAIAYDKVLMAHGYPGTGKDAHIEWLAGKLNIPYVREDGVEGKEVSDLIGYTVPTGGKTKEGKPEFVSSDGILTMFAKYGGLYVSSEPFVNPPAVNMCMQSLLEPERILKLVGHPNPEEAQFKAHDSFRILLTSNVRGTGDGADQYAATTVQDQSTLNRVDIHFKLDYLPKDREIAMLCSAFPNMTKELAKKMVQLGNSIREAWKAGEVEYPWSVRQLFEWGSSSMRYQEPVRGFKQCYYNVLTDEEKGTVSKLWDHVSFHEFRL